MTQGNLVYQEGWEAYLQGIDPSNCPYTGRAQMVSDWLTGWHNAKVDHLYKIAPSIPKPDLALYSKLDEILFLWRGPNTEGYSPRDWEDAHRVFDRKSAEVKASFYWIDEQWRPILNLPDIEVQICRTAWANGYSLFPQSASILFSEGEQLHDLTPEEIAHLKEEHKDLSGLVITYPRDLRAAARRLERLPHRFLLSEDVLR